MFSRAEERRELSRLIEQGRSVLLLGPRRVGKTWLRAQVAADLRGKGWSTVLCDVEGMSEEVQFLRHLCQTIEKGDGVRGKLEGRIRQWLNQLFSKDKDVGWQQALLQIDWVSFLQTLVEGMDQRGHKTLILVDELSLFIAARASGTQDGAKGFLYQMRALDAQHKNVRWLFSGSIGLDIIARSQGIDGALVELHRFMLQPFDRLAARAFLDHLSNNGEVPRPFSLDAAAFKHLIAELGWLSPYDLENLAREVRPGGRPGGTGHPLASIRDIDTAFMALLSPERRYCFATWEEYLKKNFNSEDKAALHAILDACARKAEGERFDTLLAVLSRPPHGLTLRRVRDLLTTLEPAGFLSESGEGDERNYRFRSGLLRRYWLHRDGE